MSAYNYFYHLELVEEPADLSEIAEPPFLPEWPALTLKLLLLHTVHLGVDALGSTCSAHQDTGIAATVRRG